LELAETKNRGKFFMKKTRIISQKRVQGKVECNDGEFAEIQTVGIEGIEKDLLLETIQKHRDDRLYSRAQFQGKLLVGSWLEICTTIEVTTLKSEGNDVDEDDQGTNRHQVRL
jgi:hypothetical protein